MTLKPLYQMYFLNRTCREALNCMGNWDMEIKLRIGSLSMWKNCRAKLFVKYRVGMTLQSALQVRDIGNMVALQMHQKGYGRTEKVY